MLGRSIVLASCAALAGCVPVPMLVSQSTLVPIATPGQSAEPRGLVGANVRAVIRPFDVPVRGDPTPSTMYVPRVQLEPSVWLRAGRYVTVAAVASIALSADSYALSPTTSVRPSTESWALGLAVAGLVPIDRENRFEMGLQALFGQVVSDTVYLPPDYPCGTGCTRMRGSPYAQRDSLPVVLASTHVRYVHQFGPAALILLAGLGTQPVNGYLGGETSSMTIGIEYVLGGGARVDVTEWLAIEVLVAVPAGAVSPGPLVSIGFTLASRELGEPLSATNGSSPRRPE